MNPLDDLYNEVILGHGRNPRNEGRPDAWDRSAEGYNPLCGDRVEVFVVEEGEKIVQVRFEATGCLVSRASASLLTEWAAGRRVEVLSLEIREFLEGFDGERVEGSGDLRGLLAVGAFPSRVKCATLPWQTFTAALRKSATE